jgi:two-component system cell cycle sensor histidine kinase/response regulator CckA
MKDPGTPDLGGAPSRVQAHLDRALDILGRLSFGDYHIEDEIDLGSIDADFVDLFAGLVVLARDLREMRDELAETNHDLERQVRERTEELEADIRKREAAEAALRASESMYRRLVETSPDPIVLVDLDAHIRMANRAFLTTFRIPSEQTVVGTRLFDYLAPGSRERATDCWKAVRFAGATRNVELDFRRHDDSDFSGELRSTRVAGGTTESDGILCIVRDLTEARRREREQLRAGKLESLGTLAGGIAHDFNNALAAITGTLFLAAEQVRDVPDTHALLLEALDAAFRSTALTKQLLTFSMGGAPVTHCVPPDGLVRQVVEFCLRGSPVTWCLDLGPDLWPIEVDEGQFEQVLGNLVINAKQAMPQGGNIAVGVENVVTADPDDATQTARQYVRISVRDSGTGIAPEDRKRVFDPYFSTKPSGSGLGLATAYSVTRKHGGFLDCESTPGEGSTFSIYLPASERTPSRAEPVAPVSETGSGRILVMDDDDGVRSMTRKLLAMAGYETAGATTGSDAVSAYAEAQAAGNGFAAVIMDLTVSGGDGGKEAIVKLLKVDKNARAIVASGYSDDPVLADYRRYGFVGMLAKPFRFEDLVQVVQAATSTTPTTRPAT